MQLLLLEILLMSVGSPVYNAFCEIIKVLTYILFLIANHPVQCEDPTYIFH